MSRPRLFTPEEIRERRRLRGIEYRKRNREKIRAYKQRPEVRERRKAENRKWRESHPDYNREYYAAHHEYYRARYVLRVLREMVDCEYYARNRQKARERAERKRRRDGKPVRRPLLSMRIPDWCVRGMELDVRSQWLINNLTDSQRAYARELAIERRAR